MTGVRTRLVTLGETMGLITAAGIGTLDVARTASIGIGGAESNVAIGVARLGGPVSWISRLGRDAMGDLIVKRLTGEGIDTLASRDDAFTGLMVKHCRAGTAVRVDYHRAGSAASRITPDDLPADLIGGAAILHVTGITPALSASAARTVEASVDLARAAGTLVSLDINYRSKLWTAEQARPVLAGLAARADLLFAGVEEAQLVLGVATDDPAELAAALAALGPREVVIKTGAHGCTALIDGAGHVQPAPSVPVVDPVGAGDAFVAGYLAERLLGAEAAERLRTAVAMGAYAVTVPGDCELLPTRDELGELHLTDVIR